MSHRSRHPACLVGWLVIELLAVPATGRAALNAWTAIGPRAGASWTAVNSGLIDTDVLALAIDPATPSTLYAGTDGGVFKSTNAGASWTAINSGLTHAFVTALAINPATPTTLYAGTRGGGAFVFQIACGDGIVDGSEQCDDGNTARGDGCSATCTIESGWTCSGQPSVCTRGGCR